MDDNYDDSLGGVIRRAREHKKMTLRMLACDLRITHPYLSDIERNRRIPSEIVLARLSARLGLNFDLLMQLAGRVGEKAERYIQSSLLAGVVFRRIAEHEFDDKALVKVLDFVDDLHSESESNRTEGNE